jgi:hypothetical protein
LTGSGPVEGLTVSATSPTSLVTSWSSPAVSNGIVSKYLVSHRQLQIGGCAEKTEAWSRWQKLDPDQMESVLQNLSPYSRYQVRVLAETEVGLGKETVAEGITQPTG